MAQHTVPAAADAQKRTHLTPVLEGMRARNSIIINGNKREVNRISDRIMLSLTHLLVLRRITGNWLIPIVRLMEQTDL